MSEKRSRIKIAGFLGVGVLVALGLALVFSREPTPDVSGRGDGEQAVQVQPPAGSGVGVQILKPQRRDIAQTLALSGNIAPWYQATLYAKVPGYLKWMGFDKGDAVKKGELLAVIDAPEVRDQYLQAAADYEIKRVTSERLYNVWKKDPEVIAQQDVDVAQAAAKAARHLMDNRRSMLEYTKVYAPFEGVITARFADPGSLIQAATASASQAAPLYTIMDLSTVRVYVSVPQEAALYAKPGAAATITVKELPEHEFKATITRTTRALDSATRTLLAEIDLPNKQQLLQAGIYVNVTLTLRQHQHTLVLPPSAIASAGAGKEKTVFIVDQGKARRIPIKTDIDTGSWVEVVEGLTGDEDVVVVGKGNLTDGQVVQASPFSLPSGKPSSQKY